MPDPGADGGGAECIDTRTDPQNCNGCGSICPSGPNSTAFCSASVCRIACAGASLDCNANPADGCEVDPTTNRANCGRCGNACVGALCIGSNCICPGSGPGTVDQSMLFSEGNIVIGEGQIPGQTFVAGVSGILTAVEVGLGSCNGVDNGASVQLTVVRGGATIATASIAATAIPVMSTCVDDLSLSNSAVGAGYFDLSDQCVPVTSGDALTFLLSSVGGSGTCSGGACVGGEHPGYRCFSAADCTYVARAGEFHEWYLRGTMVVNGNADVQHDLDFKVFVR